MPIADFPPLLHLLIYFNRSRLSELLTHPPPPSLSAHTVHTVGHNLLTPLVVLAPSCPDFASEALQPAPGIFLTGLCPLGQTERSLRVFWNKVFHTFFVFALLGISHFYTAPVPLVEGGEWVTTSVLPFQPKLFWLMK